MGCKIVEYSKSGTEHLVNFLSNISSENLSSDSVLIGKGFRLDDIKHEHFVDIKMLNNNRRGHLFGFGTTGAGKSRFAEALIEQDIYNKFNVVIIDPKIDNGMLSRAYQSCVKSNREKDFMLLSTIFPQYSIKINPLSHFFIVDEIISHIIASVPANDEFFLNIALEVTSAIVYTRLLIKKYTRDETPINFYDIYKYVSYNGLVSLKESLYKIKNDDVEIKQVITLIENTLNSPMDYFSKVTSTLRTTVSQMSIGSIGKVIGNASKNEFISRLERDEGVVLYVQTPSMISKKNSDTLAKVVLSMIQSLIGRRSIMDKPFVNPLSIYIDEASNALYMGVENLFNKSRSTNTMITALTQNYADLEDSVGKEKAKMIVGNTNAKLFFRLVDIDTATDVARYGGQVTKYSNMLSTQSIMTREAKEDALTADDILTLDPREFFYFGMEGKFKGKTVRVNDTELKIIMPDLQKNRS